MISTIYRTVQNKHPTTSFVSHERIFDGLTFTMNIFRAINSASLIPVSIHEHIQATLSF